MAKGSIAKQNITKQILSTFEGAFEYNGGKEIRVPVYENGELVQIKITLTCAKENVECGADSAVPGSFPVTNQPVTPERTTPIAPTEDEKQNVANLLRSLGL